jgi:RHS repeat-associated protein
VTRYLVDDLNPTGYVQVVEELNGSGAVTRTYTYGLQRIDEEQELSGAWTPSFYGYDGGGNVRQLTNLSGAVTDSYEYDAYGNSFTVSGSTPNEMMYRGEQYDPDLGLYYLRARYYNPLAGRFMSRDPESGDQFDPKNLHKYLYAGGDPVDAVDPSGKDIIGYRVTLIAGGSAAAGALPELMEGAQEFAAAFDQFAGVTYLTIQDITELIMANEYVGAGLKAFTCSATGIMVSQFLSEQGINPDYKTVALSTFGSVCTIWIGKPLLANQ